MAKTIICNSGGRNWKYFLVNDLLPKSEPEEVSEEQFIAVVGTDRSFIPMEYEPGNINRQNFFLDGTLIGYREML